MSLIRIATITCTVWSCTCLAWAAPPDEAEGKKWKPLFNGRTLEGWEGNAEMFRVEDKAIVAGSLERKIPRNEFLCTEQEFGDFELRLKARLVGKGDNAGIQFRSQRVPDHHEVSGYQCDVGSAWGLSIWGWLYDESRRNRVLAPEEEDRESASRAVEKLLKKDGWNELRVRCKGPRIQIWLNGGQTVDYTEADQKIPRDGIIGLQIHSGPPAEAWYKDIEIRQLD